MLLFKCISAPARLRPKAVATASVTESRSLTRISGRSEGFGSQIATKSPPGPNLQSGSACLFISGFIFFPAFRNSSNSLSRKCSIGRAHQFTQTKTEQKYAAQRLFFHLLVSILIGVKIWDYSIDFFTAGRAGKGVGYKCSVRVRYERQVQYWYGNQIGILK